MITLRQKATREIKEGVQGLKMVHGEVKGCTGDKMGAQGAKRVHRDSEGCQGAQGAKKGAEDSKSVPREQTRVPKVSTATGSNGSRYSSKLRDRRTSRI